MSETLLDDKEGKETDEQENEEKQDEKDAEYWKHRFDVVSGMQRKSEEEKKGLEERIRGMESKQNDTQSKHNDQEYISFKDDLGDEVDRKLRAIQDRLHEKDKEIERLKKDQEDRLQSVTSSIKADKDQMFFSALGAAVPDWKNINSNPKFLEFLEQPEGFSGRNIDTSLKESRESGNATVAIAIFNEFKNSQKQTRTSQRSELTSKSGGMPGETGEEVTMEQLNLYHQRQAAGYYKTHPEELKTMKARIDRFLDSYGG